MTLDEFVSLYRRWLEGPSSFVLEDGLLTLQSEMEEGAFLQAGIVPERCKLKLGDVKSVRFEDFYLVEDDAFESDYHVYSGIITKEEFKNFFHEVLKQTV